MSSVRVWAEKVIIPTYPVGKPDKNPMFLEHRVYQGASGRVYPHTVIDTVSDEKENRAYTALCLENEYLYIMVLPELGGRVQRALDKTNGYDFVYYNEVIKPAMVGLTGPWISGGIEFNWPQHHRPSTFDPVEWTISENPDGSCSIIVGETETMYRTRGVSRMTLCPGKAYLEITTRLHNRTEQMRNFLWWANPAVHVNDHTRSIFPKDVYAVMDHGRRDVSDFPIAHGTYYKMDYSAGVDISRYKNVPVPTSFMAAHSDADFLGNYDDEKQAGLLHVADHHISPGKKQWTWGNGEFGQAWDRNLTDASGPYIELMTGCFTDNQPDFTWMMPGEEKNFTQYFMPYKGVGSVANATREAVIGLEREDGRTVVRVYASACYENARLTVKAGEEVLFERELSLSPEGFEEIPLPLCEALLECRLTDAAGKLLVKYRETKPEQRPLPEPAQPIPPAEDVESMDKLYYAAVHLEQYHHATWDAADYLLEGLKRDPDDVRINHAYGRLLLGRGLIAESVPYLKRAVEASTIRNPNPADGACHYDLGAALNLLGQTDEAYDAFYKAAWSGAWQGAAYARVGCIDLRRGEADKAEAHLREALRHSPDDTMTLNALAALYRHADRPGDAAAMVHRALAIDPLDPVALWEKALLKGSDDVPMLRPDPAIEAALEYARAGFAEEAAAVLRHALKTYDHPLLWQHLAHITGDASLIGKGESAPQDGCFPHRLEDELALSWCIDHAEKTPMAHHALGCYWYDKRRYDRALSHWEAAAQLAPDYPTVHRNLALAYYNKFDRPADALRELELAFRLDESDARVFMELDQLLAKLHTPAAERLARLEKHPGLVDARDDLRLSYVTLLNCAGRYEEALSYVEARHFHPWEGGEGKIPAQWRISLIMQARRLMERAEWAQALPLLERAAGPYPHNLGEGRLINTRENDADYWIGLCLRKLGRDDEADAAFTRASLGDTTPAGMLYYNDQPPESIFYQGLALEALGQKSRAAAVFAGLRSYAAEHMEDKVKTEYFAVSLPDLAIFDEDLTVRNRVHCLLMEALGAQGERDIGAYVRAMTGLIRLAPGHQGTAIHCKGIFL